MKSVVKLLLGIITLTSAVLTLFIPIDEQPKELISFIGGVSFGVLLRAILQKKLTNEDLTEITRQTAVLDRVIQVIENGNNTN